MDYTEDTEKIHKMTNFLSKLLHKKPELSVDQIIRRKTIYSFTIFFVLIIAASVAWIWLIRQPLDGG